jgi:hypothetical protein
MGKFNEKFLELDQFAAKVSLTYRGKSDYKTRFGAVMSLMYFMFLFSYAIYGFIIQTVNPIESIIAQPVYFD